MSNNISRGLMFFSGAFLERFVNTWLHDDPNWFWVCVAITTAWLSHKVEG